MDGVREGSGRAYDFFASYLAAPVVLVFWAAGYLWKRQGYLKTSSIDVDSGRREVDWERVNAERAKMAAIPAWRRWIRAII